MTQDNKEQLLQLLQKYKELGIAEQIDYEKFYLYSLITHSTAIEGSTTMEMVDKHHLQEKMVSKWSIKPSLGEKLVDVLLFVGNNEKIRTDQLVEGMGLTPTTAKRYLRQLAEFGYLEAHGGNRNIYYSKKNKED